MKAMSRKLAFTVPISTHRMNRLKPSWHTWIVCITPAQKQSLRCKPPGTRQ
jgi:hypothetical protein